MNALVPERDTDRTGNTNDVYWCTADIGWITGHSYIVYGPLCNGATSVMFEGWWSKTIWWVKAA